MEMRDWYKILLAAGIVFQLLTNHMHTSRIKVLESKIENMTNTTKEVK